MVPITSSASRAGRGSTAARLLIPALVASLAGSAALGGAAEPAAPELRLEYAVRAWMGARALAASVGTVVMELSSENLGAQPARVLRVRTRGNVFGIRIDALNESFMTPDLSRQLAGHYVRTGSEETESKLVFTPTEVEYHKFVHCDAGAACTNPAHRVAAPLHFLNGRRCHCSGCSRPEHFEWRVLARHPSSPGICDMFASLYLARSDAMTIGGPPQVTRCVADLKLWDIALSAPATEKVTVPAGTFEAARLEMRPTPANAHAATHEFRGPFGLGPDARLWVDPGQRILVRMTGTAHMALTVQMEMALVRVTRPQ